MEKEADSAPSSVLSVVGDGSGWGQEEDDLARAVETPSSSLEVHPYFLLSIPLIVSSIHLPPPCLMDHPECQVFALLDDEGASSRALPAGYAHLYPFPAHISLNLLTLIRFLIHFLSRSLFVAHSRRTFYNHGYVSSIGQKRNKKQEFNFKTIPSFNLEWEELEIALVRFEKRG
jgi:hypothetical protein